jgi:NADPH:quinone reductase-like Zn-dependent oxidoreductase
MKAAVRSKYGSSDVLSIKEVPAPTPKNNELLIRVYATTVNRSDCHVLTGKPFPMRLFTGLFKPRSAITGSDFAGQIKQVGKDVKNFHVGDQVMGFGGGFGCAAHAQFIVIPEAKRIVTMPDNLSYDQAAACLEGAYYAASIINGLKPKAGQKALVYGATGAIGSSYVQFLKFCGVYVTAVCKGENAGLIKSLGADKVIDYLTNDFTKDSEKYDFVFDAVGKTTFFRCKPILKDKGLYTSSGGVENIFLLFITPIFGGKRVVFHIPKDFKRELNFIKELILKGKFRPVIDRKYPLENIAEAYDYVASEQKIGNVVITVD